ncbi:CU044_5270 family protein [Embleya sp. NPDC020630]|uniref:CU044_5270 family protein n=1 Tax=Embleya sp. NPDC020630 TaxID=3363979 RepID=UPI0037B7409B
MTHRPPTPATRASGTGTPVEADRAHPHDDATEHALARAVFPAPERHRLLEEHLMREITGDIARTTRVARPRRLPRFAAPVGAVGAVLALMAGVTLFGTPDTGPSRSPRTTVRTLDVSGGPPIPTPGQVLYTEQESSSWSARDGVPIMIAPHSRKEWVSRDGRRLFVDERAAGPYGLLINDPPKRWNYLELSALPATPQALSTAIRERLVRAPGGDAINLDQDVFDDMGRILQQGVLPPGVSGALYEALTRVPGVVRTEQAADGRGRRGVGLARTDPRSGLRRELILDPATGALLGVRDVVTLPGKDHPIGAILSQSTMLESGIVDSMPDGPPFGFDGSHTVATTPTPGS